VEDPFSVLSALVPDPPCAAPLVTPLFPPPPSQQDSSQQITLPLPINVPPPTEIPTTSATTPAAPVSQPTPTESSSGNKSKYRHWTIARPTPQRGKAKDPTVEERPPTPEWRKPRPLHTADYGLFPSLATTGPSSPGGKPEALATQERLSGALYASLENPPVAIGSSEAFSSSATNKRPTATATIAQSWLREVVYGGWDGLAYTRSVAEFVTPHADPSPSPNPSPNPDEVKVEEYVSDRGFLNANAALAEYIDAVLVNELTEGRHRTMEAALAGTVPDEQQNLRTPVVPPTQLDLGSLISAPNELFDAENAWVGAGANEDSAVLGRALDHATHLLEQLQQLRLQQARRAPRTGDAGAEGMDVDIDVDAESESDPEGTKKEGRGDLETELRMNLIALAKRAPLDQIARMPSELVPPHLRHVVPTIGY
jgi:bromodomain-containing protein 7